MTAFAPGTLYRFTVEDYHALGAAGVLGEDDRVELIDGLILAMSPVGLAHITAVNRLTDLFAERLYTLSPRPALVSVQNPLRLDDGTEPLPDVVLLRPGSEGHFPTATDAILVVEVADPTLDHDRDVKCPRYALAGVPELWIVDLEGRAVEVYRRPGPEGYAEMERLGEHDVLTIQALPDLPLLPVHSVLSGV
jgi:Uma2 family endonuclease